MLIKFIEIQNFRKLKSCRIELSSQKTLFVGANNSGKTSAMDALLKILTGNGKFSTNDITISNYEKINAIGEIWWDKEKVEPLSINEWRTIMPAMDIWIKVEMDQIHYVTGILPSLDWNGGLIGVRLSLEPKNIEKFFKDFRDAYSKAKETQSDANNSSKKSNLHLWPKDMKDFLDRKMNDLFSINAYILDSAKITDVKKGVAYLQEIPDGEEPLDGNPLSKLISIKSINAQRGFTDPDAPSHGDDDSSSSERTNLSSQLRAYYNKHIDPEKRPDQGDLKALEAISYAQLVFDEKLREGFASAINELESMGYPGFTDPQITVSTKVRPVDTLKHESAVQYSLIKDEQDSPKLPERYNGLGYQNLISIVFNLISFRDDWMREGKAGITSEQEAEDQAIPPLQLVLIEEPEAHLHAQVQQVFIRKAYDVLRNHKLLKNSTSLSTQLVVSTHSSNIAHAVDFKDLRYFKRKPAYEKHDVPTSSVINLSDVFGEDDETSKFIKRYLKTTHCDLFFADAVIMIEGPAERMLLPHFIDNEFPKLNESYISILEIGGSHAYRMKPLIEHLGLITLIITDLDTVESSGYHPAAIPECGKGLVTGNSTLKTWIPKKESMDVLIDLDSSIKLAGDDVSKYIRVAYQIPTIVNIKGKKEVVLSRTFEDTFVFHNIDIIKDLKCEGYLAKAIIKAVKDSNNASDLKEKLFESLKIYGSKKAEFALELLFLKEPHVFSIPQYINEGLAWLCEQLENKHSDVIYTGDKECSKE